MITFIAGIVTGYMLFTDKGREYGNKITTTINKAGSDLVTSISKKVSKPTAEPTADTVQSAEIEAE